MPLLSVNDISIDFGGPKILEHLTFQIKKGQRVCLLGRNGAGKSTLLKIMAGLVTPDSGDVRKAPGLKTAYCAQDIPSDISGPVFEIIAGGMGERGRLLARYFQLQAKTETSLPASPDTIRKLYAQMDTHHAWQVYEEVNEIISRMELDGNWNYEVLSGGQKRRVILARALVSKPDVLMLDEPTNHLDIPSIAWLENFILRLGITLVFVTHDRVFLKNIATRIVELDRGKLFDWSCDYETFLKRKEALLEAEEKSWDAFDKKLAQEEVWLRRGIKARRTRNEGRVRALKKMREERNRRRQREGQANIQISAADKSGTAVIVAEKVSFAYAGKTLIKDFNLRLYRGDKLGIVGPNGCGKTTLVNLLLGKIPCQDGTIKLGTNLSIAYFDQLRARLDNEKSAWENIVPNGDSVTVNGQKKHIISYLQDFLFSPERAKTTIAHFSGGERNRLLLAKMFARPGNFIVLDEPTNDLDAETLALLEDLLVDFPGTVLLISHDRAFLNNVVSSLLVFEGGGRVKEYVGGYDDYLAKAAPLTAEKSSKPAKSKKEIYLQRKKEKKNVTLSYMEKRELQELPALIEKLETRQEEIHFKMGEPEIFRDHEKLREMNKMLAEVEAKLEASYARWETLEEKKSALKQ